MFNKVDFLNNEIIKGAVLTSATVPWHGLIFMPRSLKRVDFLALKPRNIVYKPRGWSFTLLIVSDLSEEDFEFKSLSRNILSKILTSIPRVDDRPQ